VKAFQRSEDLSPQDLFIARETAAYLTNTARSTTTANVLAPFLALALFFQDAEPVSFGIWIAYMMIATIIRTWRANGLPTDPALIDDPLRNMRVTTFCVGLIGVGWGLGWILVTPDLSMVNRMIYLFVTTGAMFSGVFGFGVHWPAFLALSVPIFVPAIGTAFWPDHGFPIAFALGIGTLFIYVLGITRKFSNTYKDTLRLRLRNESLYQDLAAERDASVAANVAKSRFIAAASHDLRQPVTSLKIVVELLRDPRVETAPERRAALLARLDTSVNALDDLLTGILDLSRLEADVVAANLAPTALSALFEGLREAFLAQASARGIELQFAPTELVLVTDRVMLARMVRNLVDNALRYTTQGSVHVDAVRTPQGVSIRVIDTGPGIPADQHQRIFEDFVQLHNPARDRSRGLGLGLAIVRRLSARLGYQVTIASEPGQGTTFSILIPADRLAERALLEPSVPEAGSSSLRGLRVLLVEDDPLVRDALSLGLARLGAQVTPVSGVNPLRAMLQDHRATPAWDACVTDMRMEGESSGYQVIAALAGRLPRDRVVVLTGETRPDLVAAMTANGLRLVHKPATSAQVAAALRQALAATLGADAGEAAGL